MELWMNVKNKKFEKILTMSSIKRQLPIPSSKSSRYSCFSFLSPEGTSRSNGQEKVFLLSRYILIASSRISPVLRPCRRASIRSSFHNLMLTREPIAFVFIFLFNMTHQFFQKSSLYLFNIKIVHNIKQLQKERRDIAALF